MLEYAPPPRWEAGLFDTLERTNSVQSSSVHQTYSDVRRGNAGSLFTSNLDRFTDLDKELALAGNLTDNWNSYGAPRPTNDAISLTQRVLSVLKASSIVPRKIMASAEGGIAILFKSSGENRAMIESLNDGYTGLLLYDRSANIEVLDWDWSPVVQSNLMLALTRHLQGARLAATR